MNTIDDEIRRIAIAYDDAPDEIDQISKGDRFKLRKIVGDMFHDITISTHFEFVDNDPYDYVKVAPMKADHQFSGLIRVNTSGNESELWGKCYNLMFRAVHDYIHVTHDLDFNYGDEVEAHSEQVFLTINRHHIKLDYSLLKLYSAVLRSEIIYQAAYKTYFGEKHVPTQKIILSML